VASRLAEISTLNILVIEAGPDNEKLENVHMPGGYIAPCTGSQKIHLIQDSWSQNFEKETDWNVVSTAQAGLGGRQIKQSRGRFLGGSSAVNGALCIRGSRQDYDDWGLDGWSGDDMFKYMAKVTHLQECLP
jgi:choline dehydrogenase-like flavoprotein